jgi:hypothetical protein
LKKITTKINFIHYESIFEGIQYLLDNICSSRLLRSLKILLVLFSQNAVNWIFVIIVQQQWFIDQAIENFEDAGTENKIQLLTLLEIRKNKRLIESILNRFRYLF